MEVKDNMIALKRIKSSQKTSRRMSKGENPVPVSHDSSVHEIFRVR